MVRLLLLPPIAGAFELNATPASNEYPCDVLPFCTPAVNAIRRVAREPEADKQRTDVWDSHSDACP